MNVFNNVTIGGGGGNKLLQICAVATFLCCGTAFAADFDDDIYENPWADVPSTSRDSTKKSEKRDIVKNQRLEIDAHWKSIQKLQEQLREEEIKRKRAEQEKLELENQVKDLTNQLKKSTNFRRNSERIKICK